MKRELLKTDDGSFTLRIPEWREQYHSTHGAIQEAYHVYIKHGLHYKMEKTDTQEPLKVLEIGFGTGLNCLISLSEASKLKRKIYYTTLEYYPVEQVHIDGLNYAELVEGENNDALFSEIHSSPWEKMTELTEYFSLEKRKAKFEELADLDTYDVLYYDAFGSRVQPELWEEDILKTMYNSLKVGGVFVTYCCKGSVRRYLKAMGFEVEKLVGPPGKREMLRAIKV
ncbi:MAG: tRNA (5-methylaminomethyl-2-thiouridine)(34)-methyltransferase MnmD [Flavobacteriaceae bacterium]|nr:tRNA (5-methylaminomethyl-2-thiouridine)(34)-methyltransferase MnmD [Flavobacteriaceae bacterium]